MVYEEIRLVKPTLGLKDKALEYRQEHFDFGKQVINGSELFDKIASYEEWFEKGYATEILRQVCFVARKHSLKQLQLSVEKDNVASIKTIEKNDGNYCRSFTFDNDCPICGNKTRNKITVHWLYFIS